MFDARKARWAFVAGVSAFFAVNAEAAKPTDAFKQAIGQVWVKRTSTKDLKGGTFAVAERDGFMGASVLGLVSDGINASCATFSNMYGASGTRPPARYDSAITAALFRARFGSGVSRPSSKRIMKSTHSFGRSLMACTTGRMCSSGMP